MVRASPRDPFAKQKVKPEPSCTSYAPPLLYACLPITVCLPPSHHMPASPSVQYSCVAPALCTIFCECDFFRHDICYVSDLRSTPVSPRTSLKSQPLAFNCDMRLCRLRKNIVMKRSLQRSNEYRAKSWQPYPVDPEDWQDRQGQMPSSVSQWHSAPRPLTSHPDTLVPKPLLPPPPLLVLEGNPRTPAILPTRGRRRFQRLWRSRGDPRAASEVRP